MYVCVRVGRQRMDVEIAGTTAINEWPYPSSNVFVVAGQASPDVVLY